MISHLYPLTGWPHGSSWYLFSISATTNKPNLFKYRCDPGSLWLEDNDKRENGKRILALTLSEMGCRHWRVLLFLTFKILYFKKFCNSFQFTKTSQELYRKCIQIHRLLSPCPCFLYIILLSSASFLSKLQTPSSPFACKS